MAERQKMELDLGSFYDDNDEKKDDRDTVASTLLDAYMWRRGDEKENLSDWTIVITTKPIALREDTADEIAQDSVKKYHVHKAIVGAGPRGTQYFLRLFVSNQEVEESKASTSTIELEGLAAIAFPDVLDFMYAMHTTDVVVSTKTAVAMRYLANYFGVPTLFENVNTFIQKDMNWENIQTYLEHAQFLHDEKIIEATMLIAAEAWAHIVVEEDGKSAKESAYMKLLPESQQFRVWNLAMFQAALDLKQKNLELNCFHRMLTGTTCYEHVETIDMPLFGDHEPNGFVNKDGRPLFFFQR